MTREAVMRRLDHVIVRVGDLFYDELHTLFAETFALPTAWPVNEQPGFRSGGIFAGNLDLEFLSVGDGGVETPTQVEASLYGTVFESASPFGEFRRDLERLAERDIPYVPSPYVGQEDDSAETWWMNAFLGELLGSNAWMKLFFTYKRVLGDSLWLRLASGDSGRSQASAQFLFDRVYPNGIVFLVKYNPAWRDVDGQRAESEAEFQSRGGGPLGLVRVQEIEIGLKDFGALRPRWARLLAPYSASGEMAWPVGDGPAIRLVPAAQNEIQSMVWQVRSLAEASAFLSDHQMLGLVREDEVLISPSSLHNLHVRLVE